MPFQCAMSPEAFLRIGIPAFCSWSRTVALTGLFRLPRGSMMTRTGTPACHRLTIAAE